MRHSLSILATPCLGYPRCSLDWKARWMGNSQGFDLAPRWSAHCQGKSQQLFNQKEDQRCRREAQEASSSTLDLVLRTSRAPVRDLHSIVQFIRLKNAGLATIANMGAEVGATTSTFPYSARMRDYLIATGRSPVAQAADKAAAQGFLSPDEGTEYDQLIQIVSAEVPCSKETHRHPEYRICPRSSPPSTVLSLPILQRPSPSSESLPNPKDGRMNFLPGLLVRARTVLTRTW